MKGTSIGISPLKPAVPAPMAQTMVYRKLRNSFGEEQDVLSIPSLHTIQYIHKEETSTACVGYCKHCQGVHSLPMGKATKAAVDLMLQLDQEKRIDFYCPPEAADPRLSTDYLFGKARGKMYGVMVCQHADGSEQILKAFSGQYNGFWDVEGWAPPLFDLKQWRRINDPVEKTIKQLGTKIETLEPGGRRRSELIQQRSQMSRELMKALHKLYVLHNFRSQGQSLDQVYMGTNGIPNGTADCCGPKLLNYAAQHQLRPLGIAEFYYGRANKQGTRTHGRFYSACKEKCAPILGYMLCGIS